jgi:hypothetical protein
VRNGFGRTVLDVAVEMRKLEITNLLKNIVVGNENINTKAKYL